MAREEDKHRAPAYVPPGPVRIVGEKTDALVALHDQILAQTIARIAILESQVKSLQVSVPRGIHIAGWHCPKCRGFVGEEKEIQPKCIYCETAKP